MRIAPVEGPILDGVVAWAQVGREVDHFVSLTEGVLLEDHHEPREPLVALRRERAVFEGGRRGRVRVDAIDRWRVDVEVEAPGAVRVGLTVPSAPDDAFAGLGARHHLRVDHAGRELQLGADRRYTGPDCPPELLEEGGIPMGDYAPVPYLCSSAGWSAWVRTDAPGCRVALDGEASLSVRAAGGPLRVRFYLGGGPPARLRRFLADTGGFAPLLPEWGYGFWKSRDVYPHRDDAEEDVAGCRAHGIPVDALVLDSPWETQYNTWRPNEAQFPDFEGMVRGWRADGIRTVVWITPWTNLDAEGAFAGGQVPPDPVSQRSHQEPADNWAQGDAAGHFVRDADGATWRGRWWMGSGSLVDFTSEAAEAWWRAQSASVLALGVEGIKADDGEGYYVPPDARLADGRSGAQAAWALGGLYRRSMQRALDEAGGGVLFGRSGWTGQQTHGVLWGGDQASDAWSLHVLVAAGLSAASSGCSNWSHDVGGYLGERLVDRCAPELLVRWAQLGCFTALMQAHGRMAQEPWRYDAAILAAYRAAVVLHERLVPYIRAAAATAARCGLPIMRPLSMLDPADARGWRLPDAFGFGPSLWVAPVLDPHARSRRAPLPRGRWVETWSGAEVRGGRVVEVDAPLSRIPVWVRAGAIVVTYPEEHVARGLGDAPEVERPLEATLWAVPVHARAMARLADGTRVRWSARDGWSASGPGGARREVAVREVVGGAAPELAAWRPLADA